ncbi:RcnB family protein [Stenotrophomonas sp. MH1]|uniref:RcnB family protein n=1 Tax=Stenotrophomonas capsici TaxID=3110230 RepID=A0ABU5V6I3_9GAMM|nr:RcnB family protein [Stenotrophomonas sp. MH1]MEA5668959.1 RcnB family protein [Stenotrophomonas sp. MH1]
MKRIFATALSLSLLASASAFAGPVQDRDRHDPPAPSHAQQHPAPASSNGARHAAPQSAHHAPRKGERLSRHQRGTRVADYAHHGLRKPGRGNEWRRIDDRYVLIAIATGLVMDIASGR